jgi:hypothetical protein
MLDTETRTAFNAYGAITDRAKRAILRGLQNGAEKVPEIDSYCPSSNCTFQSYDTLAVCTSFANVSSHLEKSERMINGIKRPVRSLSKDIFIREDGYINATSAAQLDERNVSDNDNPPLKFSSSIAFKNVSSPLVDMFVLYPEILWRERINENVVRNHLDFRATEVLMEWCIQKRTTEIHSGNITTHVHQETRNFSRYSNIAYYPNGKPMGGSSTSELYRVSYDTHTSTSYYLGQLLQGFIIQNEDFYLQASTDVAPTLFEPFNTFQATNVVDEKPSSIFKSLKGNGQEGLERIFNNIAESMTNLMRGEGQYFEGTQFRQVLVVQVRWPWIIAHAIFVGFSIILLVATIISQRISSLRGHTWKSSSLAVLHALDPSLQQTSGGISDESRLSEEATGQLVRLRKTEAFGWRLG